MLVRETKRGTRERERERDTPGSKVLVGKRRETEKQARGNIAASRAIGRWVVCASRVEKRAQMLMRVGLGAVGV